MSKIGIIVRIKELFERDCKTRNTINQNESFDLIRENSLKMVDSHSLNSVAAPTSAFNFKSGDISGTAAKTSDDKMGQGNEYYAQYREEEQMMMNEPFVDRSAQLRATLNSLAMMNVANLINKSKKKKSIFDEDLDKDLKQQDEEDYEQSPED